MKKLLIVTDAWTPQINGVVTVFNAIIPLLEKRGVSVSVAHPGLFRMIPFPLYPEVPMVLLPDAKMEEIFEAERPDYVHIATEWTLGASARSLCLRENIPFTTSYHTNLAGFIPHYLKIGIGATTAAAYRYMRWFHNAGLATMVSSPSVRAELRKRGFKNVIPWPFGVDTNFFARNDRLSASIALKKPVFIYFGRLAREKKVEEFLGLDLPGTKLVIGDGPYRATLEKKYPEAKFVGYKRGEELVDWLSLADVLMFPSRTETFGLVIVEALSCGIPVAAHNVTGPKDIITHGVDGFLGEDLREAALACLSLSRQKCREKALMFSWEHSADLFLRGIECYSKIPPH